MDANLFEVRGELLARVIVKEDIQRSTEMTIPVDFHNNFQHDLIFRRRVCQIVKTSFSNWIQDPQVRFLIRKDESELFSLEISLPRVFDSCCRT